MKKMIMAGFCMLVCIGQASAACVGTLTASTPTADFVDHGNGTVTHTRTGLMWKQCSEGLSGAGCATGVVTLHTWQAALQLAETLNAGVGFATFKDWRVPNRKELNSIVERQCANPAVNGTIFPSTLSTPYWSASPSTGNAVLAWGVNFSNGFDSQSNKSVNLLSVRFVRGGL